MERTPKEMALTSWSGEFRDRQLETRFRHSIRDDAAKLLKTAMLVSAMMFALLALTDYTLLGTSASFFQLLGLRLLVAGACLATGWAIHRHPDLTFRFLPLNPVLWLGCTVIILMVPLRPDTLGIYAPSIAVAVMALYLFVPNRIPWMVAANLYLALGFLAAMRAWAPLPDSVVLIQALALGFANAVGLLSALRLARLQRQQYASLLDERAYTHKLKVEIRERRRLEARLRQMAGTDELTGLDNRRRFHERAERALRRARRQGTPLTLCMIDLDHFKTINDRYGHMVGDQVLAQVAGQCRAHIRDIDLIGRFGGEEFVVALPDADLAQALEITERLRGHIECLSHPDPTSDEHLTVTIGIARVEADEDTLDPALKRADEALYRGKSKGRNVVMVAGRDDGPRLSLVDG